MPRANLNKGLLTLDRSSVVQLTCRKVFATVVSHWHVALCYWSGSARMKISAVQSAIGVIVCV
jgi:hypothetical protein